MQTKYCVYCLKRPAKVWSGHVLRYGKHILAGWCRRCNRRNKDGFFGQYKWRMGRENNELD